MTLLATLAPRWRKVLRDLFHNKTRTLLVILSIAIGVMGIGMISGARVMLGRDMQAAYDATNPFHAVIWTDGFDDELVRALERMPAVAQAEGRRDFSARVQIGPDEWKEIALNVIGDYSDIRINKMQWEAGDWPPPKRTLLLERASLAYLNKQIGDTIHLELRDGSQRTLQIAGRVHDVNQVVPIFAERVTGYITLDTLESLGYDRQYEMLYIRVAENGDDREHIMAVTEEVKSKIERSGRTVYGDWVPTPGEHWAHENTAAMLYLLGVLGILSLLLSGFLVVNTMSALMTQQIQQIGVMKAMGARASQLLSIYLVMVMVYGLLSLVVAVPLGALGALGLTSYIASLLNFDIGSFEVAPQTLAIEMAVGLITPVVASLLPTLSGVRITVREAISDYGLGRGQFGQGVFDEMLRRIQGTSRPLLLSIRNTFRRKARLLLVLVTLTLASAIFISVLSVQASLMLTLDDAFRYWNYDVRINFARAYRIEALEQEALRVPGTVEAEAWGFQSVVRKRSETERSDGILMIAPTPGSDFIDPLLMEGRWLLPADENALVINTEVLQEEPDLRVGDTVVLEIDDRETEWQIVGLVKQPLSGPFVYVNYPAFLRATRSLGRVDNLRVRTELHDADSQVEMAQRLENHFEEQGFRVSITQATAAEQDNAASQMNIIVVFLLIMAVLLAVVGGLGLMGTMFINVLERTREVGVMRAIGASTASVQRIVITEGIVIGVLSWLFGALIALPIGRVLSNEVGQLFLGAPASYAFSTNGALLWLAIVTIIATIASSLPAWNASRLTVRETLAYQ